MFGFPDIDSFHKRQVFLAVSRQRAAAVADLARRLSELRYSVVGVAVAEHEWLRAAHRDKSLGHDPAEFLERIARGPIMKLAWGDLTRIDRPTFTDRWLRTVACGMAYGPGFGALRRELIQPHHFKIHDDVLALFAPDCEIRHSWYEDGPSGWASSASATSATYESCFVLRDRDLTGAFVFGEED